MMVLSTFYTIDRAVLAFFNDSSSLFFDGVALALTSGYTWIPLYVALLYIVIKNNETMAQIGLVIASAAVCVVLADGMADFLVKPIVARWRPSNDPVIKYTVDIVAGVRGDKYSFFSAHAANTMAVATYFCILVRSRLFTVLMVSWSLVNCWTRLYLGLHYPSDILAGLAWGMVVGVTVYMLYHRLYARISPKLNYVSTQYTPTGYCLSDIDVVACVMSFTLVAAVIYSVL